MNLLKDEKVEKIMGILKKNAITNEIQEEIKKILKRKSLIKRKEEDIIKILEGTHDLNNSNSEWIRGTRENKGTRRYTTFN